MWPPCNCFSSLFMNKMALLLNVHIISNDEMFLPKRQLQILNISSCISETDYMPALCGNMFCHTQKIILNFKSLVWSSKVNCWLFSVKF